MQPSRQPFRRAERYAVVLRQIVSEALLKKFPHLGLEEITITEVRVTDDLHTARIFYRVMNPEHRTEVAKQLGRMAKVIRKETGKELNSKFTPQLIFEYDDSLDYGHRIDELLAAVPKGEFEEE